MSAPEKLTAWPEWATPCLWLWLGMGIRDAEFGRISWWEVPIDVLGTAVTVAVIVLAFRTLRRRARPTGDTD